MAYNSASAQRLGPDNGTPQGQSSMLYPWQNAAFPQSAVADPYAGNTYTGNQTYTPPEVDQSEYWNAETSGYDQMPEYDANAAYEPYDAAANYVPQYIDPKYTDWENANRYAPWSHPNSPGGVESANQSELMNDPTFWNGGGKPATGSGSSNPVAAGAMGAMGGVGAGAIGGIGAVSGTGLGMGTGALLGASAMGGPLGLLGGGLMAGLSAGGVLNKKKKRQHLTYQSPSYQGYMFTPEEGNPKWYMPSEETQESQATQQDLYSQQPTYSDTSTQTQTQTPGTAYDYNYTGGSNTGQQSYVGQRDENYGSSYGNTNSNNSSLYDMFTV